ncbi:hypothetical protein L1887_23988 [Cichorium endivia]|nr:hypothetical protein L1887_23988 [Cichorium endivia]
MIPNIGMESLETHPLHTHADDTDGMETDRVDYYDSFFDMHYTRITYKRNFEEDYEVVLEDEFDIEYVFDFPNNGGYNTNGNGSPDNFSDEDGSMDSDFRLEEYGLMNDVDVDMDKFHSVVDTVVEGFNNTFEEDENMQPIEV